MSYEVIFVPGAEREFDKLPRVHQRRLADAIDCLAENPRPTGSAKLTHIDAYKLRIGDYRVIYTVKDQRLVVLVLRIADRREVYRDMDTIRRRLKKS